MRDDSNGEIRFVVRDLEKFRILTEITIFQKIRIFSSLTTDIDIYLSVETIPFEDNEDFEILEWWKKQQIKYPVLSIIACDVLTVHVSTVASEAAFSAGGRVASKK